MYQYRIIRKSYGYVVLNVDLGTHAHIPNYEGCKILLHLIKKGKDIKTQYLRHAKERLIGEAC